MPIYRFAELRVQMNPQYPLLKKRSEPYLYDDSQCAMKGDICISVTPEEIALKQKQNPQCSIEDWEYMIAASQFYSGLLQYQGMLLHSSAISYQGKAYLFSGPSGRGKSTHTNLWKEIWGEEVQYINDDKPALRIIEGEVYAYGTPFSGKSDLNTNVKVPVGGICFLEQSKDNVISKMELDDIIYCILSQTIRKTPESELGVLLELIEKLVEKVPVYQLSCNISKEAAMLAYERMVPKNN